ncbi:PEP-CTERM protein-sorting domain-containing protein [Rubritalea squalenifaciens DSM 18772]|uniref:PEP-CTERM protein-sorting domain-containing protein n=3 Tax=Rubritaleaceae TaxID=1648490 RepID=A0A1M6LUE0_9BACT|nr:PEP-CTERM protein-sorting domain-containing protein [Rubritalea squalenifaciens DSM 18772]
MTLATAGLLTASSQAALVLWDGGTGSWSDSNWNGGGAAPAMDGTDDAQIDSGLVTYTPGGDFGLGFGSSNVTVSGGELTQTVSNWWQFDGSTVFTVSGGVVNTSANNVQFGNSGADTASLVITSGEFNHTGNGEFKLRGGNTMTVSGGSFSSRFLSLGDFGAATIDVSGGVFKINDGSIGANGIYIGSAGSYIDITANGVMNVGNISVSDAITAYLDSDKVRFGGDIDNALLSVTDDGAGGVNISAIPEPAASSLIGMAGLLLLLRRRR